MARVDSFFSGQVFGLPSPVRNVPFGGESREKALTGLTPIQLRVAVALVAAEFAQVTPVTSSDVWKVVGSEVHNVLTELQRAGFAVLVGKAPRSTRKLWKPSPKAWRELGLVGWSLLKEVA